MEEVIRFEINCTCGKCLGLDSGEESSPPSFLPWPEPKPKPEITFKTQKAKGIQVIEEYLRNYYSEFKINKHKVFSDKVSFPAFGRPCPKTPRHGFVDSRVVNSKLEAEELIAETLAADPEGEILFAPVLNARYNAVYTPGMISIGPGNDGATAGKDTVSVPVEATEWIEKELKELSGIDEAVYAEFITQKLDKGQTIYPGMPLVYFTQTYLVQLRGGPRLKQETQEVEVKKVILAEGDLLEWESKARNLAGESGLVIWHPGGSSTSHYAVHAALNNLPVCYTNDEPRIGDKILVGKIIPAEWNEPEFKAGFTIAWRNFKKNAQVGDLEKYCKFILGVLHTTPFHKNSRLVGAACAYTIWLGALAICGELRHSQSRKPVREKIRHRIYTWRKFPKTKLQVAIDTFMDEENFSGASIGGYAWANCTFQLLKLINKLGDIPAAIQQLNVVINCAHNNGWWFNKFSGMQWFDIACKNPSRVLCTTFEEIYYILKTPAPKRMLIFPQIDCPKSLVEITAAQIKERKGRVHVQYMTTKTKEYQSLEIVDPKIVEKMNTFPFEAESMASGSPKKYVRLIIKNGLAYWPDGEEFPLYL